MGRRRGKTTSSYTPRQQLELFYRRVGELAQERLLLKGLRPRLSLKYTTDDGLSTILREPDEVDLRSFVLSFRHFFAKGEPVHLYSIYALCDRLISSDELRGYARQSREHWKEALTRSGIGMNFNGREITPEHITDLWINGHYFHSDQDKMRELESLMRFDLKVSRFLFLSFLCDATRQVMYLGDVVGVGLRKGLVRELPVAGAGG